MSLECTECRRLMSPDGSLPGDDGVMITPYVLSHIWVPEGDQVGWQATPVAADLRSSLCYSCIEKQLDSERSPLLQTLYSMVRAESSMREVERSNAGKWMRMSDDQSINYWREYDTLNKTFNHEICLFCGKPVTEHDVPRFVARSLDRVYGMEHTGGLLGEQNYSWRSGLFTGFTKFSICFTCVRQLFPHLFEAFSAAFRGVRQAKDTPVIDFTITDSALSAMWKELGSDAAWEVMAKLNPHIVGPRQN